MNRRLWLAGAFAILAVLQGTSLLQAQRIDQRAIVYIETSLRGSKPRIGTGFYRSDGSIVTSYHVIRGAARLRLYTSNGDFDSQIGQVTVVAYSPSYDLAVLRDGSRQAPQASLQLHANPSVVSANDTVTIHGHPQGIALQQTSGKPTQDGLLESGRVNDKNGKRVFNENIRLIPIDVTTAQGMSGGPVILDGEVVGVLCASLEDIAVRTFTFAIPSTYVDTSDRSFVSVDSAPEKIRTWNQLTLINESRIFPRAGGGGALTEPYFHLFASGPSESGWKKVGTFQTLGEAELAALKFKNSDYSTHVSKVMNGKYTPPSIKR
jgi:S1-C subfamily serine protease